MPRLTSQQKERIVALREAGRSWNFIERHLCIKKSTVRSVYSNFLKRGNVINKKSSGRPVKISPSACRLIKRRALNEPLASLQQLTNAYNEGNSRPVSQWTIKRALRRCKIFRCIAPRKLALPVQTRQARIKWCSQRINWTLENWASYIFSDEVRFGFQSDGIVRIWRHRGKQFFTSGFNQKSSDRRSLMFWGFISSTQKGQLIKCPSPLTSSGYIEILQRAAIQASGDFGLTFVDDNAPIHRSGEVKKWMQDNEVQTTEWPARSPDLNPIENLWGLMKRKLSQIQPQPKTLCDLEVCVQTIWEQIPHNTIINLYKSMPKRVEKCRKAHGYPIHY